MIKVILRCYLICSLVLIPRAEKQVHERTFHLLTVLVPALKRSAISPMYRAIYQKQPKAQVKFTEERLSEMSQTKIGWFIFCYNFFLTFESL